MLNTIITSVLTIFGGILLLIDLNFEYKIIIILMLIIVYMIAFYIKLYVKYKKIKLILEDRVKRHTALAQQFNDKNKLITRYRNAINELSMLFTMAVLQTPKSKMEHLYNCFLEIKNRILDGGLHDGKDL